VPELLETSPDLRTYLRILSRRKLVIAATVVVLVALAVVYDVHKKPLYTATAQVMVPQQSATSALDPQTNQLASTENLQRNLTDDQELAQGAAVASKVREKLGFKPTATVTASSTADVLSFAGVNGSPTEAARIANTYAKAYIAEQEATTAAQFAGQVTGLQGSIARLRARVRTESGTPEVADEESISTLTQSLQDLQAAGNLSATTSGTIINAATPPTSPSSPKKLRDVLLALLAGLLLGVGLAFVVDRLDDTVKSFDDVEEFSGGLPVLGTIPRVDGWGGKGETHLAIKEDSTSPASESYRTLRTAVQFLSLDEPKHVIGVTSAVPDEGKTTTVANLALSFARAGQRVIVVSFDFRKPKLHTFFGTSNDSGVTSVLLGQHTLKEAIKTVEGEPRLRVLSSGPVPPNPAEILAINHVVDLVDALSRYAEVVLIDCPPVLPVTDTLLVSRLVDGLLVLIKAGSTKKPDLRRTIDLLNQVHAPILGMIVNSVPRRGGYAYEYGYGYGYGHRYAYRYGPPIATMNREDSAQPLGQPKQFADSDLEFSPDQPAKAFARAASQQRPDHPVTNGTHAPQPSPADIGQPDPT